MKRFILLFISILGLSFHVKAAFTTTAASSIAATSATSGGNNTAASAWLEETGICWAVGPSASTTPTVANFKNSTTYPGGTNAGGNVTFSYSMTGLTCNTTYTVRAYTISNGSVTYATTKQQFTTLNTISITTTAVSAITSATASSGGSMTCSSAPTAKGVCWNTSTNPTIANSKTSDGAGSAGYGSSLTGLLPATTYYVKAYVTDGGITYYGNQVSFTTLTPSVTTTAISSITSEGASTGGTAITNAIAPITKGICYALSSVTTTPTISNSTLVDGTTTTANFTSTLTGLLPNRLYYARAYVTQSGMTFYGSVLSFTTLSPSITTTAVTGVSSTVSSTGGNAITNAVAPITKGVCYALGSVTTTPTTANSTLVAGATTTANFTSSLSGLTPGSTYYVRAYVIQNGVTFYGSVLSFTTLTPSVTTTVASGITTSAASSGGTAITNATAPVAKGICYSTTTGTPTIADATIIDGTTTTANFTSALSGLAPNTRYYVRAYVTQSGITYYGSTITFRTTFTGTKPVTIDPEWRFGTHAGLSFSSGGVATPTAAALNAVVTGGEASTSICDSVGVMEFYTNSSIIYNTSTPLVRNIELDDNIAGSSSTQGTVAVPDPASPFNTYYLFIANDFSGGAKENKGINYYKLRRTGATGTATIISGPTNLIGPEVDESIMITSDGNDNYWLASHSKTTTEFYIWPVTAAGVGALTKYAATGTSSPSGGAEQSCVRFNLCADKIAWGRQDQVRVHAFNKQTGEVTLAPLYAGDPGAGKPVYQVEFSPEGDYLYVSGMWTNQLLQVDLTKTGAAGNGTVVSSSSFWGLQLGPNGNIYASGAESSDEYWEITNVSTNAPTPTLKHLAAGTSQFRGISNLPIRGSVNSVTAGGKLKKSPTNCRDYMFGYRYYTYANDPITVTSAVWTFTMKVAPFTVTTVSAPSPFTDSVNYILPTEDAYDVYVTVTDAYCGQTHKSNVFTITPNCSLPVEFINISAVAQLGSTKVFWSTALEINSELFEIQRSVNGRDFVKVGSVAASGNSSHVKNYSFVDFNPLDGISYYRVVEKDFNGALLYSSVVSTDGQSNGKIFTISNNPFKNEFSLNILGERNIKINIFDASGKLVYSNKVLEASGTISLGSDISSGIYLLEVTDEITGLIYREKLFKN